MEYKVKNTLHAITPEMPINITVAEIQHIHELSNLLGNIYFSARLLRLAEAKWVFCKNFKADRSCTD